MVKTLGKEARCAVARAVDLLGDKWTLLIVREAFWGSTQFSQFRDELGIAPDVLTARLTKLVADGVFDRRPYRDEGSRERHEYVLTEAGADLHFVIAGLSRWGADNRPREDSTGPVYTDTITGEPLDVAFVTADGRRVEPSDVTVTPALRLEAQAAERARASAGAGAVGVIGS